MLPVLLNLTGKRVVVVGGGAVGRRKALAALDAGAVVTLVDPLPAPPDFAGGPRVTWLTSRYEPSVLAGVALVFAAATPDVNAAVVADANAVGVWANSASDPDAGDLFLPATVRRGGLTVAVSTGGASPALARRVRERLEAEFDAAFGEWVAVLAAVRERALADVADPAARRALLDGFADWPWLDRLRAEGADAVRDAMLAILGERPA